MDFKEPFCKAQRGFLSCSVTHRACCSGSCFSTGPHAGPGAASSPSSPRATPLSWLIDLRLGGRLRITGVRNCSSPRRKNVVLDRSDPKGTLGAHLLDVPRSTQKVHPARKNCTMFALC